MKSRKRESSTFRTVIFSFCTALILFALLRSFIADPAEKVAATPPPARPIEAAKPIVIVPERKIVPIVAVEPIEEVAIVAQAAPTPVADAVEQKHTVKDKETLSSISKKYYGTETKWEMIWEANKTTIPNKNKIRPGVTLIIPENV